MDKLLTTGTLVKGRFRIVEPIGHCKDSAAYLAADLEQMGLAVLAWQSAALFKLRQKPQGALSYVIEDDYHFLFLKLEGQDLGLVYSAAGVLDGGWAALWMSQVCDGIGQWHSRVDEHLVCLASGDMRLAALRLTADGRAILPNCDLLAQPAQPLVPGQSLSFSAPEKELGQRVTARSDVYALGAALYCLVTGTPPPPPRALAEGHAELVPPRQIQRRLPGRLEKAVLKAMDLDPSRRQASARQLGFELDRCVPRRLRRLRVGGV